MDPLISVVIPARDEERYIGRCIASVIAAAIRAGVEIEIIVVLNRCTDQTETIARSAGARIVKEDAKNLSRIRNAGAEQARGKILVTVDADSRMSARMLLDIVSLLQSGRYIGGGVLILPERWSLGIILTGLLLTPIVIRHGIAAGVFFCSLEDFKAIGGFNEKIHSAEDIDFAKRLKAHGRSHAKRFKILLRSWIITSCRKFDTFGDWYFIKNPSVLRKLLEGHHQALADKLWYDFER